MLSSADQYTLDENIALGYEVRSDQVSFELPYLNLTLLSEDDIITMCGNMLYTINLLEKEIADFPDIQIVLTAADINTSANITVQTDN